MLRWLLAGFALVGISIASWADSTINPLVPADNSSLSSAILRQQFQSAINDINALQGQAGKLQAPTGVVADSTTDNCGPLNVALTAGDVFLPSSNSEAYYRTSCTIVVPFGRTLRGWARTTAPGITQIGGAKIVCDATVSPCIKVGTGNLNQMASMYNIYQGRAGGVPASTTIGVWVSGGEQDALVDVQSDNNGINFLWGRSTIGAGAGLSHTGTRLGSYRAVDAHMVFDGIPDVRITGSHIGSVAGDYNAQAAFRFTCTQHDCSGAGGTNTIRISDTQVNQAANGINCFAEMKDADPSWAGDYGDIGFDNIHAEVINAGFCSDSSWKSLRFVRIQNSFITSALNFGAGVGGTAHGGPFFQLDPATNIFNFFVDNSTLIARDNDAATVAAFRLFPSTTSGAGIAELHITGSTLGGNTYFTATNTGSTAYLNGASITGNLTIDGGTAWAAFVEVGDNITGTYTETAGNNVTILNNRQIKISGGGISNLGVSCAAGITAGTFRSVNGITTHC